MTFLEPDGRPLIGEVVRLDLLQPSDAAELFDALDDARVYLGGYGGGPAGRHTSMEQTAAQIDASIADPTMRGYAVRLVGEVGGLSAGTLVGTTTLGDILTPHGIAHVGWTGYAPAVWGTAVNPECKLLILGHAFDTCGFGRIKIQTDGINAHSQAAIAKLGAVREGVLRRHRVRADGTFRDTVVFSILDTEWAHVRSRLETRLAALTP